ncbi:MAG: TatD family hydrolase [Clostridia bacterium]|nr:TatD family hydrolase [Clostridia bacterium]
MLFDSHAHFDDERFDSDRDEIILNANKNGVSYILNAASDMESAKMSIALSKKFHFLYAAVGVHPHNVSNLGEGVLSELVELARNSKVVAIGEIGLDYYYDFSPKDVQQEWFGRQINLARELKLPVIIHNRDAHEDTMRLIKSEKAREVGGVLHCYSGSVEMAKEVLEHNLYISVGGPVTFKNAKKTIEVVKYVPLDRLLIETDCPYLTPEPYRGKRNDSSFVRLVAEKIAEIKGISYDEAAFATLNNAKTLFKIE